ncbi:MAG: hypothetical protein CL675_14130 [Bdellovibrionaceae bacterium]|nr:hypothetical protein [Pseudobdellovibrionaceae bacterium]
MSALKFVVIFSCLLAFASCSSQKTNPCETKDWFEQGRIDGIRGDIAQRFQQHLNSCPEDPKKTRYQDLYHSGRSAGLTVYCQPSSGFELGRSGTAYKDVCPTILKADFLRQYLKGQKVLELEKEKADLQNRKREVKSILDHSSPSANVRKSYLIELDSIEDELQEGDRRMSRLLKENKTSTVQ